MNYTFFDGHDELYQHAKFGEDRTTRAGCSCENVVCFLFVGHALSRDSAVRSRDASELDMGPFCSIKSNPIHDYYVHSDPHPIQSTVPHGGENSQLQ